MQKNIVISETLPFAALTVEQAGQFIRGILSNELKVIIPKEKEPIVSEFINIIDAINLLKGYGYPITKGSIYNYVSNKSIPYRKVGKRIVFSRSDLITWIEQKFERKICKSESALILAESARKKSITQSNKTSINTTKIKSNGNNKSTI